MRIFMFFPQSYLLQTKSPVFSVAPLVRVSRPLTNPAFSFGGRLGFYIQFMHSAWVPRTCRAIIIIRQVHRGLCSFKNAFLSLQPCGRVDVFPLAHEEPESLSKNRHHLILELEGFAYHASLTSQKRNWTLRRVEGLISGHMARVWLWPWGIGLHFEVWV